MTDPDEKIELLAQAVEHDGHNLTKFVNFCLAKYGRDFSTKVAVEEVLSDVIYKACQIIRSRKDAPVLRSHDHLLAWVRQIAVFKSLEYVRRFCLNARRQVPLDQIESELLDEHQVTEFCDAQPDPESIIDACKSLSLVEREVLMIYLKERRTSETIAVRLDKKPAAVRQIKRRAIEKLRLHLETTGA